MTKFIRALIKRLVPIEKQFRQNFTILIPRPAGTADSLVQLISQNGGDAIYFPVIEFVETEKLTEMDRALTDFDCCDIAVFVSVPAVSFVLSRLAFLNKPFPQTLHVAVMGNKTAQVCRDQNIAVDFIPEIEEGTQGLLQCFDNYPLKNKKVLIFRGQDGMDTLRQQLKAQGAMVNYVECYCRAITTQPIMPILDRWRQSVIDAVLISSDSILQALLSRMGKLRHLLENTPVVAFSERIAEQCHLQNINNTIVVDQLEDKSILRALQQIIK